MNLPNRYWFPRKEADLCIPFIDLSKPSLIIWVISDKALFTALFFFIELYLWKLMDCNCSYLAVRIGVPQGSPSGSSLIPASINDFHEDTHCKGDDTVYIYIFFQSQLFYHSGVECKRLSENKKRKENANKSMFHSIIVITYVIDQWVVSMVCKHVGAKVKWRDVCRGEFVCLNFILSRWQFFHVF